MPKNDLRLKNRIALVTGGTSGIGLAVANRLAQDGARVLISSRKQENVDAAIKQLSNKGYEVTGVACHISNRDQRRNLVKELEKLGGLDILVQCAGVNPHVGPFFDCPEDAWDKLFDTNLKSNFLLTKEVIHLLKQSKCGRVVYNSSMAAYFFTNNLGPYGVSKMALVAFTKAASVHLGKYNITVNCVAPGVVDTQFADVLFMDQNVMDLVNRYQAINRICKPEEVAGVVSFLASEDSSYVSGETICVSGGVPCRL